MSASKFDRWFEDNREELEKMLRNDDYEMLYKAWSAGYAAGCDSMSKFISDLSWYESPDRSGGQFTDEEIARSRRGGEGW